MTIIVPDGRPNRNEEYAHHSHYHGLFLKLHNLSNRQDAKVAKTNKFDVSVGGETTSGKLGVLGVWAVKNAAYVVLQKMTMFALWSNPGGSGGPALPAQFVWFW